MTVYSPGYKLSKHFALWEFVRSDAAARLGIDNWPDEKQIDALARVALWLEHPRRLFGPIYVSSGLRVPAVNTEVIGSSSTSVHQLGFAADWTPVSVLRGRRMLDAIFQELIASSPPAFDQLIFECASWIHVGLVPWGGRGKPRGQIKVKIAGQSKLQRWKP